MEKLENSETFHVTEELRHRSNVPTIILAKYCCFNKTCSRLLWDNIKELSRHKDISESQKLFHICELLTYNVLRVYEPEAEAMKSELLKEFLFQSINDTDVFAVAEMLLQQYYEQAGFAILSMN